jgi:ABC-2 type transport system permease protein
MSGTVVTTFTVARLELRRLLVRPLAWVLAALSLADLAGRFILLLGNFLGLQLRLAALPSGPGLTQMVSVPLLSSSLTDGSLPFGLTELAFVVVPLLSMSMLAGDRRNGTLPLLFGSGLPASSIVLGKYFALLAWLLCWLLLTLGMPLALANTTSFDWGQLAAATIGLVLLLAALAAIGLACSAFVPHPAIAAGVSMMLVLGLCVVNLGKQKAGVNGGVINWLALPTHLEPLLRGLMSSADVIWFLLLAALALTLAIRRIATEGEHN